MTRLVAIAALIGVAASSYADKGPMSSIVITQGTVGQVGSQRVGVRWIDDADFTGKGGTAEHGRAAGLSLFPPERMVTVGLGSTLDVNGTKLEVVALDARSITLQPAK